MIVPLSCPLFCHQSLRTSPLTSSNESSRRKVGHDAVRLHPREPNSRTPNVIIAALLLPLLLPLPSPSPSPPSPRASTDVPPLHVVGAKPSKVMRDGRRRTVNLLRHQGSHSPHPTPVDDSTGGSTRWHRCCPCCGEILSPPRIQLEAEVTRPALLQVSPLSCLPQLHVRCSWRSVHLAIDPRSHSFPCGFITKVKP
jgi:ribosomal protein L32